MSYRNYHRQSRSAYGSQFRNTRPTTPVDFANPSWVAFKAVQGDVAAWVEAKASSFDFAASMFHAVVRFGDLTPGQYEAIERMIQRDQARQTAPQALQRGSMLYPRIRAAFDTVVSNGAVRAQITVGNVNLSLAPASGRNPGALYVKFNGEYAGKIIGDAFQPARAFWDNAALFAALTEIEADPVGAVRGQAERTAAALADAAARGEPLSLPCGCCGITLTDPVSIARGIGPICAGKWGF